MGEGENEGNLGFCEDTNNEENTNNQIRTLIQKIELSDDDFDENWEL